MCFFNEIHTASPCRRSTLSSTTVSSAELEGDARDPCVEVAFAAEGEPSLPEGAGDFLVEIEEVVAAASKVEANLVQGGLARQSIFRIVQNYWIG